MTTHHGGRVSPFGHPRINALLTTPRGLTQPYTSFIGPACQGIHHVPLHKHTHQPRPNDKTRPGEQHLNKQPHTTPHHTRQQDRCAVTQKIKMLASTIQFSHNTPPAPPPGKKPSPGMITGDHRKQQCCPRHPTACQHTLLVLVVICGCAHHVGVRPPDQLLPAGQHS